MAKPVESQLTVSCLQCDWSVKTVNTPPEVSRTFLEAAHSHAAEHEQHVLEKDVHISRHARYSTTLNKSEMAA